MIYWRRVLLSCHHKTRREEAGKTNDPRYHSIVSHPLEKCITLKEHIMQLAKDGTIIFDLDEAAETNHTII